MTETVQGQVEAVAGEVHEVQQSGVHQEEKL